MSEKEKRRFSRDEEKPLEKVEFAKHELDSAWQRLNSLINQRTLSAEDRAERKRLVREIGRARERYESAKKHRKGRL